MTLTWKVAASLAFLMIGTSDPATAQENAKSPATWPEDLSSSRPLTLGVDPAKVRPLAAPIGIKPKPGLRFRFRKTYFSDDHDMPISLAGELRVETINPKLVTARESISKISIGGHTDISGDYALERQTVVSFTHGGRPWARPAAQFVPRPQVSMGEQIMAGEVFSSYFGDEANLLDTASDCATQTWLQGQTQLTMGSSVLPDSTGPFLDRMAECALALLRAQVGAADDELRAFIPGIAAADSLQALTSLHDKMRGLIERRWPGVQLSGSVQVKGMVVIEERSLVYAAGTRRIGYADHPDAQVSLDVEMLIDPTTGQIWRAIEHGTVAGPQLALDLATPRREPAHLRQAVEYSTFETE